MSIHALDWALEFHDLPPDRRTGKPSSACKFVLIALANHASREGTDAFPSVETIMDYTELSERNVQYALKRLEEHGTIARTPNPLVRNAKIGDPRKRPVSYDLVAMSRGAKSSSPRGAKSADGGSQGCKEAPSGVQSPPPQGCKVGDEFAPEPSFEPSFDEPSKANQRASRAARARTREAPAADPPPRRSRPAAAHVSAEELNRTAHGVGARRVVARWRQGHETPHRYAVYRDISKEVDQLLKDGADPDLLLVALRDWDYRGKTIGFLKNCYDDAVHASRPAHQRRVVDTRPSAGEVAKAGNARAFDELRAELTGQDRATSGLLALPGGAR